MFSASGLNLAALISSYITVKFVRAVDEPLRDDEGWGRLVDQPWLSTSLHEYWGVRWHQVFLHPMLRLGGYPIQSTFRAIATYIPLPLSPKSRAAWIVTANRAGLIVGVFATSGFLHHFWMYPSGPAIDPTTGVVLSRDGTPHLQAMLSFPVQIPLFALERLFKATTGRPVGGFYGRVWTWIWVAGLWQVPCMFSISWSIKAAHT